MPRDTSKELRLRCPRCLRARGVGSLSLFREDKACSIPCKACHTTSTANKWHCECGGPWVQCPTCRPLGFACRSTKRPRVSNSPRALPPDSTVPFQGPDWLSRVACKRKASHNIREVCSNLCTPFPPLVLRQRMHTHTTHKEACEHKRKLAFTLGHKLGAKFPKLLHSQTAAGEAEAG